MPPIKRYSVDAEHFIRFHVWTENFCCVFKFIRHSVDEALNNGENVCYLRIICAVSFYQFKDLRRFHFCLETVDTSSLLQKICYYSYHLLSYTVFFRKASVRVSICFIFLFRNYAPKICQVTVGTLLRDRYLIYS